MGGGIVGEGQRWAWSLLGGAYTGWGGLTTGLGMRGWPKWDGSGRGRDGHGEVGRLEKWAALKRRGGKRGDEGHETDKLRKEKGKE